VIFVFASLRLHYRNSEISFLARFIEVREKEKRSSIRAVKALLASSVDNSSTPFPAPETHGEIWKDTRTNITINRFDWESPDLLREYEKIRERCR